MTEREIQLKIYYNRINSYLAMIPNYYPRKTHRECDLFGITKSMYSVEFEIKLTYNDFMADFKKRCKHQDYKNGFMSPNRFYYVCPEDIIPLDEVPEYAGLMYLKRSSIDIIKKAPLLHSKKIENWQLLDILQKLSYRVYSYLWNKNYENR